MYPTTLFVGVREAAPMNKVKISMHVSNEIQVAHNQNVLKLPNGINFVTIMRPAHGQHIEVRLPLTGIVQRTDLTCDVIRKVAPFVLSKLCILIADWSMLWSRDTFLIKLRL
mgnify:CR=1 FL=1